MREAKKTDKRKIGEDGGKSLGLEPKSPVFSFYTIIDLGQVVVFY